MKYIVIEIQNGTCTAYSYDTAAEAQNKYYTILSYAAVSDVQRHGAYLLDNEGNLLEKRFFIKYEP